ncbi:hypothetical protein [Nocardia beijingensis]|uniref:hypothetical protein n=1 Tax=Nocardia beijingensis TaxID=95162 RepID=UPI0033B6E752
MISKLITGAAIITGITLGAAGTASAGGWHAVYLDGKAFAFDEPGVCQDFGRSHSGAILEKYSQWRCARIYTTGKWELQGIDR